MYSSSIHEIFNLDFSRHLVLEDLNFSWHGNVFLIIYSFVSTPILLNMHVQPDVSASSDHISATVSQLENLVTDQLAD